MKKNAAANEELPLTENEFHEYIRSGKIDSFKSKINSAYVSTLRLTNVIHPTDPERLDRVADGNILRPGGDHQFHPGDKLLGPVHHSARQERRNGSPHSNSQRRCDDLHEVAQQRSFVCAEEQCSGC